MTEIRVDIETFLREDGISQLRAKLRELQAQQKEISASTAELTRRYGEFAATRFVNNQADLKEQKEAILEQEASLRVLNSTVQGSVGNLQSFINANVGVDRTIKSAASSARTLSLSLGALAADDSRARDASIAHTQARERATAALQAATAARQAAERSRTIAILEEDAKTFKGYGKSAGAQALGAAAGAAASAPAAGKDVDELAEKLEKLQTINAALGLSPAFISQIEKLKKDINTLIEGGAQGQSEALQKFVHSEAVAAKEAFNAAHVAMSASMYADIKANEASMRDSVASIQAAARAYNLLHPAIKATGAATSGASSAYTEYVSVLRHGTAIADGAARGQRGQVEASILALLRDSGILQTAIAGLATPWGAVAVAGVGALAAIGYEAEQDIRRFESVRSTAESLALRGFGGGSEGVAGAEFDKAKNQYNEFAGTVADLQQELNKLPSAAQGSRDAFIQIAEQLARMRHEDPAKAIGDAVKAAQHGPEAFAKWATETYGLEGRIVASGKTLEELTKTTNNQAEAFDLVTKAIEGMPISKLADEGRKARNEFLSWHTILLSMADTMNMNSAAMDSLADNAEKAFGSLSKLGNIPLTRLPESVIANQKAIESTNTTNIKREAILNRIRDLEQSIGANSKTLGGEEQPEQIDKIRKNIEESQHAVQVLRQNLEKLHDPVEARQFQLGGIANAEQMRQAAADLQRQIQQQQAEIGRAKEYYGKDLPPGEISQLPQVQEAENKLLDLRRQAAKQSVEIEIQQQKNIAAEQQRGTQERLDAARKAQELTGTHYSADLGGSAMFNPVQVEQAGHLVASTTEQINATIIQSARTRARAEVTLANGSVSEINAAYERLLQTAAQAGAKKSVIDEINTEWIESLKRAQAQAFTQVSEFNSSTERLDKARIAAFQANLKIQVAEHTLSKDQMEAKEAAFTAKVFSEEEKRIEAELKTIGLTEAQKQKLYEHLGELYAQDAEKQVQAQEKATQAIEAENTKRLKSLTSAFDSIGSAMERYLTEGITKSTSAGKAAQELVKSITSSLIKEAGSMGSQLAGKGLAGLFGTKTEGMTDTSIGSVLSRAVGDMLGITKTVPQNAMKGVAEKLEKAAAAQEAAVKLQQNAGDTLLKAGQALLQYAQKMGVASGRSNGNSSTDTGSALDLIAKYESGGRNIKNPTSSASGPWQMLDSTWQEQARKAGVDTTQFPHAMNAPVDLQRKVAGNLFNEQGFSPWAPYNPRLSAAISGGERGSNNTVKVDPTSVAQGVTEGQQQAAASTESMMQRANEPLVQANDTTKQGLDGVKSATDSQKQAIDKNVQALNQNTQKIQGQGSGAESAGTDWSKIGNIALQGVGVASSALAAFGSHLSTTGRIILGTVGIISQLASFGKNLSSIFDTTATAAKAVNVATTLEQTAKTVNATAFTLDTSAVQTNAAAQAASAAGGGIGGLLKGLPIIGTIASMFFEQGGIVPSAAGGMVVGGSGTMSILHPREMVLPAHLSTGLQNMIERGDSGGGSGNSSTFNYNANVTGYHPYESRSGFESMLRTHGGSLRTWAEGIIRNQG